MNLFDTVSADIKAAMLARDKVRLEALRGVKKEFLEAKTAKGGDGELADDAAMKILVKRLKLFYKELIKGKMKCLKHSIRKLEKESFLYL